MPDLLAEIYYSNYHVDFKDSEEFLALNDKADAIWKKAAASMSFEDMKQLWDLYQGIASETGLGCFKAGFRLGAALMLEVGRD